MGRSFSYEETPDMVGCTYAPKNTLINADNVVVFKVVRAGTGFTIFYRVLGELTYVQSMALGKFRKQYPHLGGRKL